MTPFWIKIRTDGQSGTGTQADPFDGGNNKFDDAIKAIKQKVPYDSDETIVINILDGHFATKGFAVGKNWKIVGQGIDVTYLELQDVGRENFHDPDVYIIGTVYDDDKNHPHDGNHRRDPVWAKLDGWADTFYVADLTLDCQWPIQSARTARMGNGRTVKYGCIHAQCITGIIERVRAIHWGSNGMCADSSEAFPIFLETFSDKATHVTIQDCLVELQCSHRGGYATGINVVTTQRRPDPKVGSGGDQLDWGKRTSQAGLVRRNKTTCIFRGHGYGAAWSENVVFENNQANACKAGFNCDTGKNRNIQLRNNLFQCCNQGIWVGNAYDNLSEFKGFQITANSFQILEKWFNSYMEPPQYEYSYGVALGGNVTEPSIKGNEIKSVAGPKSFADGTYGIGIGVAIESAKIEIGYTLAGESNVFIGVSEEIAVRPKFYLPAGAAGLPPAGIV